MNTSIVDVSKYSPVPCGSTGWHSVALEVVWQVWRPPYQSKIWYGGAIPI